MTYTTIVPTVKTLHARFRVRHATWTMGFIRNAHLQREKKYRCKNCEELHAKVVPICRCRPVDSMSQSRMPCWKSVYAKPCTVTETAVRLNWSVSFRCSQTRGRSQVEVFVGGRSLTKVVPTVQPERGRGQEVNLPDTRYMVRRGIRIDWCDYRTNVG